MSQEIEAKFLDVDKSKIMKKLEKIGAKKVFNERLLKRVVFDLPIQKKGAWARVRDEVDKITMSYKRVNEQSLDGVEEIEIQVDDFKKACDFLVSVGLTKKAYQETKRIRYTILEEKVEFDIDTWPALNPWLEIEAQDKKIVKKYAKMLGFFWKDAMYASADLVYAKIYKIKPYWINNQCSELKFDNLPHELSKENLR